MKKDEILLNCLEQFLELYPWMIGDSPIPKQLLTALGMKEEEKLSKVLEIIGMAPLIYYFLIFSRKNETLKASLDRIYSENLYRNILFLNEWYKLKSTLNYPLYPIKGIYLIEKLYPDIGLRRLTDIDLIIEPEKKEMIYDELLNMGYFPICDKSIAVLPYMKHISFFDPKKRIMIELHHTFNISFGKENEIEILLKNEIINEQLSLEAHLYIMLTHLLGSFITPITQIFNIFDILFMLKKFDLDLKKVIRIGEINKLKRLVETSLYFFIKNFNIRSDVITSEYNRAVSNFIENYLLYKLPKLFYNPYFIRLFSNLLLFFYSNELSKVLKVKILRRYYFKKLKR